MTPDARRARLMAMVARRDLGFRARALVAAEGAAREAADMTDRITALLGARAPATDPIRVGTLAASLWLGGALQAELGRSRDRAERATAEARAEQARVAQASVKQRQYDERATLARRAAQDAVEARADRDRAERTPRPR